ncbi:ShlB/FhaC/HecB family hemolysin secretion/activation protein [Methylomicrobium lacus]|uniref:ShlB/FhaC/HecB family hemolysin secretion/activation protein n=1 Tax=Methylomicrobium lacus TaxID=136992 RepID=UPI0035A8EF09
MKQVNRRKPARILGWLAGCIFTVAFDVLAQDVEQPAPAETEAVQQQQNAPQQPALFDLLELRVKGNTLLNKNELSRTVYPFLGPKKNIESVDKAREALENLYKAKGYQTVSVDIPEQDVKNGVVYLQVVEGKVSRLRVNESRYFSLGAIKAGVPELAEGKTPNLPEMQKQLAALAKQSEDRKITPILRAGDTPGTLEVDLKVKDEMPLHGRVELNGRNTSATTRTRLVSSLRYDNLWQKFHSASLMYQVSPENNEEVDVWAGTYAMPLFDSDTRLVFYGVGSSSNAQIASAGALNVIGQGSIYGVRLVKPLMNLDNYFHSLTLGMDYKDFQENLNLVGSDTLSTPITYAPFVAQYSGTVRGEKSIAAFDVGAHFSVRGVGNDQKEFESKRYLAKSNYAYLSGNLNFRHDLPYGMEFASRFSGQIADSPLISNEQFSLGGAQSVRGYYETQALADNAIQGSLELYSPRIVPDDWDFFNKFQALVFVDAGRGWIKKALPGNASGYTLASAGMGLHFNIGKLFSGLLDVGIPFISQQKIMSGDPRLHFTLATEF